jgi:hypothetical protein
MPSAVNKLDVSPGLLATPMAGRLVVPTGAMPGGQARMSDTPPPQVEEASHSCLTAARKQEWPLVSCGDVVVPIDDCDRPESVSPSPRRTPDATP